MSSAPWWVDGHLDLAFRHLLGPSIATPVQDPAACSLSIPDLNQGSVRIALATIFTEVGPNADERWGYKSHSDLEGAHAAGVRQLRVYQEFEQAGAIRIVRSARDLEAAAKGGPLSVVILMEGADPIRTPDDAAWWHAEGVRVVGMTWARGSRYAGGNSTGGPLSPAGIALVRAFDALGILHDASHLSDESFAGLVAETRGCIVATHSNSRALMEPNERHLTDAQIAVIAERRGIIGLNVFGKFLAVGRPATLQDALAHVEHAAAIAGRDCVGLGSDFDGGFTPAECAEQCQRPQELGSLTKGLGQHGWNADECAGFAHNNWLRVLRAALS